MPYNGPNRYKSLKNDILVISFKAKIPMNAEHLTIELTMHRPPEDPLDLRMSVFAQALVMSDFRAIRSDWFVASLQRTVPLAEPTFYDLSVQADRDLERRPA